MSLGHTAVDSPLIAKYKNLPKNCWHPPPIFSKLPKLSHEEFQYTCKYVLSWKPSFLSLVYNALDSTRRPLLWRLSSKDTRISHVPAHSFGVEIEGFWDAIRIPPEFSGLCTFSEESDIVPDNGEPEKLDGYCIRGERRDCWNGWGELKIGPLSCDLCGWKTFVSALTALWIHDLNQRCAIHIHIGGLSTNEILALIKFRNRVKRDLKQWGKQKQANKLFFKRFEGELPTCKDASTEELLLSLLKCGDRYTWLNVSALHKHGTVEFRLLPTFEQLTDAIYAIRRALNSLLKVCVEYAPEPKIYSFDAARNFLGVEKRNYSFKVEPPKHLRRCSDSVFIRSYTSFWE